MTKKKKILKTVICFVVIIIFVAVACAFGFYWSKLDRLQFDDTTNDSSTPVLADGSKIDELTDEQIEEILNPENDEGEIQQIISDDIVQTLTSESENLPQDVVAPTEDIAVSNDILNVLLIATDESSRSFNNNSNSDYIYNSY